MKHSISLTCHVVLLLAAGMQQAAAWQTDAPFRNSSLSPEERARNILTLMTLDEKIAALANPAVPRLGIPGYGTSEGIHQVVLRAGRGGSQAIPTTSFAQVYGMGETWDPARNNYVTNWVPLALPLQILLLNTFVLLVSSTTLEIARRRAAEDVALAPIADIPGIRVDKNHALPWLWATILLGAGFLTGQVYAWRMLQRMNPTFATNTSISLFFIVTGVHAVHLLGGLIALLYAGISNLFRRPPETRRIILDVTAWYWHFMGVLWLYILGLLYFAR